MRSITFGGWGCSPKCLKGLIVNSENIDYLAMGSMLELEKSLQSKQYDIVVGWSLGGQIALRLLSDNIIRAKKLILISTPFKFISQDDYKIGINKAVFANFKASLRLDFDRTVRMFYKLNAKNDIYYDRIITHLNQTTLQKNHNLEYWLDQLGHFSCENINWKNIPTTKLIYGNKDSLVNAQQSDLFEQKLPNAQKFILNNCAHTPHLHDLEHVKKLL